MKECVCVYIHKHTPKFNCADKLSHFQMNEHLDKYQEAKSVTVSLKISTAYIA